MTTGSTAGSGSTAGRPRSRPGCTSSAAPTPGGVHLLQGGQARIGRSADADVPLDDPDVSRLHCEIAVGADGAVTVADLGSTNGTALDGRPVGPQPLPLPPGALLRIGESTLRLDTPGSPAPAGRSPRRTPTATSGSRCPTTAGRPRPPRPHGAPMARASVPADAPPQTAGAGAPATRPPAPVPDGASGGRPRAAGSRTPVPTDPPRPAGATGRRSRRVPAQARTGTRRARLPPARRPARDRSGSRPAAGAGAAGRRAGRLDAPLNHGPAHPGSPAARGRTPAGHADQRQHARGRAPGRRRAAGTDRPRAGPAARPASGRGVVGAIGAWARRRLTGGRSAVEGPAGARRPARPTRCASAGPTRRPCC